MRSRMSGGVGGAAGAILPPRPDQHVPSRTRFRSAEFLSVGHIAAKAAMPDRLDGYMTNGSHRTQRSGDSALLSTPTRRRTAPATAV